MNDDVGLIAEALPAYDIGEELGRGSWGVVISGRHRQLERDVAIKQLPRAFGADPSVRARFLAEARLLAGLTHPHIVPVYDYVEHDGLCLLVMERLTGGNVADRFRERGFSAQEACGLVVAACAGLHHAHTKGVLHRDVKPENLVFDADDVLKVADFGIAKVVGGASTMSTRAGYVIGTPAYIAPEQAQSGELSPATDVYAAGTVLFELLSGELPYRTEDPVVALFQHVHEDARPLRSVDADLPAELEGVAARALERDPGNRYGSAEDLGVAVSEAAARVWGPDWLDQSGVAVVATGRLGRVTPTPPPVPRPPGPRAARARRVSAPPRGSNRSQDVAAKPSDLHPTELVPAGQVLDQAARARPAPPPAPPPPRQPPQPPKPPRAPRAPQPRPVIAIAAVVAVALVAGVIAMLTIGGGDDKKPDSSASGPVLTSQQVVSRATPASVSLSGRQGNGVAGGTGVVYDAAKGLVITNAHVVSGLSALKARLSDGQEMPARILAQAPCDDLAVVQLVNPPANLQALPLGDSDAVQNGDNVTAMGYPVSFADPATQKVVATTGVVQSAKVPAQPGASLPKLMSTIQHSATLNPGNSGGPLVNDRGQIVGINTLSNPEARGQFYAISSNAVKQSLPELAAGKNRAYAGWDLAALSETRVAEAFRTSTYSPAEADEADKYLREKGIKGLLVFGADAGSPAAAANFLGGDFLDTINGVSVATVSDVCDILLSASPGQTLAVEGIYLAKLGDHAAFDRWRVDVTPA